MVLSGHFDGGHHLWAAVSLKVLSWLQTSVRNTTAPITGECCLQGKNVTVIILLPFDRLFNANYLLSPELLPLVTAFPSYLCPFTTVMTTISNYTKFFLVQSMKTTSFVILRAPDLCCSKPYRWRPDSVIHHAHNVIWQSSPSRSPLGKEVHARDGPPW